MSIKIVVNLRRIVQSLRIAISLKIALLLKTATHLNLRNGQLPKNVLQKERVGPQENHINLINHHTSVNTLKMMKKKGSRGSIKRKVRKRIKKRKGSKGMKRTVSKLTL